MLDLLINPDRSSHGMAHLVICILVETRRYLLHEGMCIQLDMARQKVQPYLFSASIFMLCSTLTLINYQDSDSTNEHTLLQLLYPTRHYIFTL